jgi:hypothetical protein
MASLDPTWAAGNVDTGMKVESRSARVSAVVALALTLVVGCGSSDDDPTGAMPPPGARDDVGALELAGVDFDIRSDPG